MEPNPKGNILIVEDDKVVVEIYRKKLQREGYNVSVAEDGLEAMKQLPTLRPDLVVLDLMMPKFNGADVLKFIRSHKQLKDTKVVIFTNAYMTDLAQEAAKAGADRSLLKSSSTPAQLLGVIKELLTGGAPVKPAAVEAEKGVDPQARLEFIASAPATMTGVRASFAAFAAAEPQQQPARLIEFHRHVHLLAGAAGVAGFGPLSNLANAMEALLSELQLQPKNITPSAIQTIRSAVNLLGDLFAHVGDIPLPPHSPTTLLVVDDDVICNRALVQALGRARLKSTSALDPFAALKLLEAHRFDLILLDYFMPGMDGLELCSKLRCLPAHEKTPVIFVTSDTDFRSRAQNILQQGDDVITKPIFPFELALKVLTLMMKKQLQAGSPKPPEATQLSTTA